MWLARLCSVDSVARAFATAIEADTIVPMALDQTQAPDDIATLKALLASAEQRTRESERRAEKAEARALDLDAQIAHT